MSLNLDEQIQNEILSILFQAHRSPKGRYRNVTFSVLQRDVRNAVTCEREDVLRELRYLIEKKLVKIKRERYSVYKIGNSKVPGGYTEYYFLSGDAIDMLQSPGRYSKIGYMITRHKLKILTKASGYTSGIECMGDFQPRTGFLPVDVQVAEGDKIQQLDNNGEIIQEKIVGRIDRFQGYGVGDHIEIKWLEDIKQGGTTVNITDSPIMAPVTVGDGNYVISYNVSSDTAKIVQMIEGRESLTETQKKELGELVNMELPKLLNQPDIKATQPFLDKIKSLGQTWLVPIITQIIATYFQHQLGINQ